MSSYEKDKAVGAIRDQMAVNPAKFQNLLAPRK